MEAWRNNSIYQSLGGRDLGDNDFYIVYLIAGLQLKNLKHSSSGEDSTKEYCNVSANLWAAQSESNRKRDGLVSTY